MQTRGIEQGVRRRPSQFTPFDQALVWLVAAGAAAGALSASASPSGVDTADVIYCAGLAAIVTLAAARARRWTWLLVSAVATAVAHGPLLIPALAALLVSFSATFAPVRYRVVGAAVGALCINVLLRQPSFGFHGASVIIGGLAVFPVLISGHRMCRRAVRRRNGRIALAFGGLAVVASAAFGGAVLLVHGDLQRGADEARSALAAARRGDTATTRAGLRRAEGALRRSDATTGAWWAAPARVVPLIGQQASAVATVTEEGRKVVTSARTTADVGDYQRLKYRSGRFDVQRIRELGPPIAASASVLRHASRQLADLDRSWLLAPLVDRIGTFAHEIDRAAPEADTASSVVRMAPGLLGGDGVRHYFVAFITPSELRGLGGFLGNYGELTAMNGQLRLTRSGPIAELILAAKPGTRHLDGPPDYLRRYGNFRPADYFQDVTFSPHFPFDADAIEQLYPQSGGGTIDGVVSVDPVALAALLRFTGPVTVPGLSTPLTAGNAAEVLLRDQYVQPGTNAERKDLLVEASRLTFEKLTTGNLPAPSELVRVLGPMVRQRRIMLHSVRGPEQRLFGRLAADGSLPAPTGEDVVSIATQNSGNNKIDALLHRELVYRPTVDPASGAVRTTLEIRLRNDAPASGLPPIVIGNSRRLPPGTNALTLSVYSAQNLQAATVGGRPMAMNADVEAGLRVYSAPFVIPPGATQVVRLELDGALDLSRGYRLTYVPQPMVNPDRLTVELGAPGPWRLLPGENLALVGGRATAPLGSIEEIRRFGVKFQR